jgi:hypothetical protein
MTTKRYDEEQLAALVSLIVPSTPPIACASSPGSPAAATSPASSDHEIPL